MNKITYGFYNSLLGDMVLGKTNLGLCWLGFMAEACKGNGYERMKQHFPSADFTHDDVAVKDLGDKIMYAWAGDKPHNIQLDLHGTKFQKSVWNALLDIGKGQVKTYGDIAHVIGKAKAARAVGSAVGSNPVSLIVPCHRVIKGSGAIGNYGWGIDLKRKILLEEGVGFDPKDLAHRA